MRPSATNSGTWHKLTLAYQTVRIAIDIRREHDSPTVSGRRDIVSSVPVSVSTLMSLPTAKCESQRAVAT